MMLPLIAIVGLLTGFAVHAWPGPSASLIAYGGIVLGALIGYAGGLLEHAHRNAGR